MIEVTNIKKSYGTAENKNTILKGVSLTVAEGEFVVILGASGSGKSTFLNIMSGIETADSGSVSYDAKDIQQLNEKNRTKFRKEHIGFIFQQYYLLNNLTVDKNVKMGADLIKNKNYHEIIEAIGLKEKINKFPNELSGGEQQRVSIARALAKNPEILYLDEPTGALDEETGRNVLDYIMKLQQQRKFSMVMVTHNENIAEMADRIIYMNSGQIIDIKTNSDKKTAYEIGW